MTHRAHSYRCVLINSTDIRDGLHSVSIFLRYFLFHLRMKYVSILQFSHFPWIWFNWFSDSSYTRSCKSYYYPFPLPKNDGAREWIKYESNEKHELSLCVRAVFSLWNFSIGFCCKRKAFTVFVYFSHFNLLEEELKVVRLVLRKE